MVKVSEVLKNKGSNVLTIGLDATVYDAAVLMNQHRIGALVVADNDRIAGMFTERDVLTRIVAARKDPAQTKVRDVMTQQVRVCSTDSPLEQCRAAMTRHKIRHLPVVDEHGKLIGLISSGDLMAREMARQEETIRFLHDYMQGRS